MRKRIIQDYFEAFRWSKSKEAYKKGSWYTFFCFLFIVPVNSKFYENERKALAYLCIVIPIMFCMFSSTLHPMRLPKVMFLCPMQESERREYIVQSCWLRMSIHILIGVLGGVILLLNGICDPVCIGGSLFNIVVLAFFLSGINANGYGRINENNVRAFDMDSAPGILEMAQILVTIISSIGYSVMLCWDTPVAWWVKAIFVGIALLIQLPLLLHYTKYWKYSIEKAMSYESSYLDSAK